MFGPTQNDCPNPMAGAAYQIVYEKLNPASVTPTKLQDLRVRVLALATWAAGQPPEVANAYGWALTRIMADIDQRVMLAGRAAAIRDALEKLPRPPAEPDTLSDWATRLLPQG